jgi:hypothetical protein
MVPAPEKGRVGYQGAWSSSATASRMVERSYKFLLHAVCRICSSHSGRYYRLRADFLLSLFITLKMEATCISEKAVDFQRTTQRYISEDTILNRYKLPSRTKRYNVQSVLFVRIEWWLGMNT